MTGGRTGLEMMRGDGGGGLRGWIINDSSTDVGKEEERLVCRLCISSRFSHLNIYSDNSPPPWGGHYKRLQTRDGWLVLMATMRCMSQPRPHTVHLNGRLLQYSAISIIFVRVGAPIAANYYSLVPWTACGAICSLGPTPPLLAEGIQLRTPRPSILSDYLFRL